MVLGIFLQKSNTEFLETALQTEAKITRIDSYYSGVDDKLTYNVYISYTVNGINYNEKLDLYHTGMRKGQTLTIYYNPENPAICHSSNTIFVGYFVIGFGVLWMIISIIIGTSFKLKSNNAT